MRRCMRQELEKAAAATKDDSDSHWRHWSALGFMAIARVDDVIVDCDGGGGLCGVSSHR